MRALTKLTAIALCTASIGACVTPARPELSFVGFEVLVQESIDADQSIIVMAARAVFSSISFAEILTERFAETHSQTVPTEEIKSHFPSYPTAIFSKTYTGPRLPSVEVDRMRYIARMADAQYVLIVDIELVAYLRGEAVRSDRRTKYVVSAYLYSAASDLIVARNLSQTSYGYLQSLFAIADSQKQAAERTFGEQADRLHRAVVDMGREFTSPSH